MAMLSSMLQCTIPKTKTTIMIVLPPPAQIMKTMMTRRTILLHQVKNHILVVGTTSTRSRLTIFPPIILHKMLVVYAVLLVIVSTDHWLKGLFKYFLNLIDDVRHISVRDITITTIGLYTPIAKKFIHSPGIYNVVCDGCYSHKVTAIHKLHPRRNFEM